MQGADDHVKGLVRSNVGQFAKVLDALTTQIETELVGRLRARLGGAYTHSQLSCTYTLMHIFAVGATRVKLHDPTPPGGSDKVQTWWVKPETDATV